MQRRNEFFPFLSSFSFALFASLRKKCGGLGACHSRFGRRTLPPSCIRMPAARRRFRGSRFRPTDAVRPRRVRDRAVRSQASSLPARRSTRLRCCPTRGMTCSTICSTCKAPRHATQPTFMGSFRSLGMASVFWVRNVLVCAPAEAARDTLLQRPARGCLELPARQECATTLAATRLSER